MDSEEKTGGGRQPGRSPKAGSGRLRGLRELTQKPVAVVCLLVAAAALFTGAVLLVRSPAADAEDDLPYLEGGLNLIGQPPTLDELVKRSDIVVVGRMVGIEGASEILPEGYDPEEEHLEPGQSLGITFTNLVIEVDEYVLGEGPDTILLEQTGDLIRSRGFFEFPRPEFGESMLLFLSKQPHGDNLWATYWGPWGRLVERGGVMRFLAGDAPPVPFLDGRDVDDVSDEVAASSVER